VQVGLEHAADQELGQRRAVEVVEQLAQRRDEVRPEHLRRAQPVEHEGPAFGQLEGLAQELPEVVDPHALLAERLGERVVLLLGLGGPEHVVEQQLADVPRGQPGQLQARPVHDDLAELARL